MIDGYLAHAIGFWNESPTVFLPPGRLYTPAEQVANALQLAEARATIRHPHEAHQDKMVAAFAGFVRSALALEDRHAEFLTDGGFAAVAPTLEKKARAFDPEISRPDILQACRNAWAACGLQSLFGRPVSLTPSIFAYSLLYPYSDNYLDDPTISAVEKLSFSGRFRERLERETGAQADPRERAIWRLVSLIESQYPRETNAPVYESLLDIHHAQEESLRMLRECDDPLPLVFAKGGASVLADAWLAAGTVTSPQALFAFAWGVLLQLGDDLQDVKEDRESGCLTVFTAMCREGALDEITNRTFHFARAVLALMEGLDGASNTLTELIDRSSMALLIRAAVKNREFYSPAYISMLAPYSPLPPETI